MEEQRSVQEVISKLKMTLGTKSDVMLWPEVKNTVLAKVTVSFFPPGATLLVPIMGEDSDHWASIAEQSGFNVIRLGSEWGETIREEDIELLWQSIGGKTIKGLLLTVHETSTGLVVDVAPIAKTCRAKGIGCVVSAWDTLGMVELAVDEWDVDVLVTGASEAIHLVSTSKKALRGFQRTDDWQYPYGGQFSSQFLASIETMLEKNRLIEYQKIKKTLRAGIKTMGLELLVKRDEIASPVFTTIRLPGGVDVDQVLDDLVKQDMGGVNRLKRKENQIIRIDHREYRTPQLIVALCHVLGTIVSSQGIPLRIQEGINRAQEVYYNE
ncbi:MAG: aminotransferase class V-fold PLP-dependent enzyme [Atribacterota bacterium]